MDARGEHLLPEGLPRPELSEEVRARLEAYGGHHAALLDPEVVAALKRLVVALGPATVDDVDEILGVVCGYARFAGANAQTPVADWFTRAGIDRWKSSYRALGLSWRRVKNGHPVLGRAVDLLVGLPVVVAPRGPRPHNPSLHPDEFDRLCVATGDDPEARRALLAAAGVGLTSAKRPVRVHPDGAVQDADGTTRALDARFVALLDEPGEARPSAWRRLVGYAKDLGIPTATFAALAIRHASLHLMATGCAFEVVSSHVSAYSIERLLDDLETSAPPVDTAILRDGNICSVLPLRVGSMPRAVHHVTTPGGLHMAGKTNSRAAARRTRAFFATQAANPTASPAVEAAIARYLPVGVDPLEWHHVAETFAYVVRRAPIKTEQSFNKYRAPLAGLLVHRLRTSKDTSVAAAMTHGAIDEYLRRGAAHLAAKSFTDYGNRLRHLARHANPSPDVPVLLTTSGSYQEVQPPHPTGDELVIIRAALRRARYPESRGAVAVVGFCGGCGATAGELRLLRPRHVTDLGDDGILVDLPGTRARQVMVRRDYEPVVRAALAGLAPNRSFLKNPKANNAIYQAIDRARFLDDVPNFTAATLRNTWLAWLLIQALPLATTLQVSGLTSARTLVSLLNYLEPIPVDLDRLRGEVA
ncbi:MAG: hypothetical protein WCI50_14815 [Actinomycetes bacterium]